MRRKFFIAIFAFSAANIIIACKQSNPRGETDAIPKEITAKGHQENQTDYLALGQEIASDAQRELARNLTGAINEGGIVYALGFCSTKAIQLTDSMAKLHRASIKRATDKPRNPDNLASEEELAYIKELKMRSESGKELKGKVFAQNEKVIGFYPILTNSLCLKCHGKIGLDIEPETLKNIQRLYPKDKAIGYDENQVRGIWVIEMDGKQ